MAYLSLPPGPMPPLQSHNQGILLSTSTQPDREPSPGVSLAGKRVFVTGATGFIGKYLSFRLRDLGAQVIALERTPGNGSDLAAAGLTVVYGDVCDAEAMERIIGSGVDIVMHLAAWLPGPDWRAAEAINVAGTRSLAEICVTAHVERFVYTSSIMVYGLHGDLEVDEKTPLRPYGDPYGDSKIRAEQALREVAARGGLPYAIVRPGMVYGPGSRPWAVRPARLAKAGWTPLIDGGQGSAHPVYIDNLVDLLVLCATHSDAVGETFNGVDDPVTLGEFLGAYMAMIPTRRALRLPGWLVQMAAALIDPFLRDRSYRYVAHQLIGRGQVSNRHAKQRLGWRPRVSLEEGLRRTELWLRERNIL